MGPGARAKRQRDVRRVDEHVAELLGLVRGVAADGRVTAEEALWLADWTRRHPDASTRWPVNLLHGRLERIFRDGRLDGRERGRLSAILSQLAAGPRGQGDHDAPDLPLTLPEPEITFPDKTFVFAGEMLYGPEHACEREVVELGGRCERSVTRRTDYVVIGSIAALDWSQASFGFLIDEVVQYRARGVPIAVISEERWTEALP